MVMDLDGQVAKSKTKWGQAFLQFYFYFPRVYGLFVTSFIMVEVL